MEAHSPGQGPPRREKLWQGLGFAHSLGRAIWGQGTTAKKRKEREGEIEPTTTGHVEGGGTRWGEAESKREEQKKDVGSGGRRRGEREDEK